MQMKYGGRKQKEWKIKRIFKKIAEIEDWYNKGS